MKTFSASTIYIRWTQPFFFFFIRRFGPRHKVPILSVGSSGQDRRPGRVIVEPKDRDTE